MIQQLHSIGTLAQHIKDTNTIADYSWVKQFENLQDLIAYRIELGESFDTIAERFLEDIHHIGARLMIWICQEGITHSQRNQMFNDSIQQLKDNTTFPALSQSLIQNLTIRRAINFALLQQDENKNKELRIKEYTALKDISLEVLFAIQRLNPTITHPTLFEDHLTTSYKVDLYIIITCLILDNKIRGHLSEEILQELANKLHQMVELEAAYMYLLQLWQPTNDLPSQTVRNIEIVSSTLSHKYNIANKLPSNQLERFLIQE
jgi:hypothetical protein